MAESNGIVPVTAMPPELMAKVMAEDQKRKERLDRRYNPVTGQDAPGMRAIVSLSDFLEGKALFLPVEMFTQPFVRALVNAGSIQAYILRFCPHLDPDEARDTVFRRFIRMRCSSDFYFFAYCYARIKNKNGGADIPFYLRPAQRKLVEVFEQDRKNGEPIRVILLKCRQWGGSTATDIYMAWIQIFWMTNWNSNIVGHQSTSATNVFAMYTKLVDALPLWLFYDIGDDYSPDIRKLASVGTSQNIKRLVPRQCNIQTGSARNPDSARSGDAAMAHLTEEAFYPDTLKWKPQDIIKAAISSIQPQPFTFIVRESTPNGRDNEFHEEWQRTKLTDPDTGEPLSAYKGVFVAWFEIESYRTPMTFCQRQQFAASLYRHRNDTRGNGAYYWHLLQTGATLEGVKWYVQKAKEYADLDDMKQEYPSDDIEAFKYSGTTVFDEYQLHLLEDHCTVPAFIGDIEGDSVLPESTACMEHLRLVQQPGGPLSVWTLPYTDEKVLNQYVVAVDIGGSHATSDFHDIVVLDRYDMMDDGTPEVVAEWHGHCDADQLAMRCAQIAAFYNNALLVIENNTAYSRYNDTDGDVSRLFFPILEPLYDSRGEIYCTRQNTLLRKRQKEVKLGFNTNRSTKEAIINNYRRMVRKRFYVERESEALTEMSYYMLFPNGTYGGAPGHHDDRVMARAIALWVSAFDMPKPAVVTELTPEEMQRRRMIRATNTTPPEIGQI